MTLVMASGGSSSPWKPAFSKNCSNVRRAEIAPESYSSGEACACSVWGGGITRRIGLFARESAASGQRPRTLRKAKQARHIKRHPPIPADKDKPGAQSDKGHTRKNLRKSTQNAAAGAQGQESCKKEPDSRPPAMQYASVFSPMVSFSAPPCRYTSKSM